MPQERPTYRTYITYVDLATGEVIEKEDLCNYIIKSKIKENVTRKNEHVRIEYTYTLERSKQLRLPF